MNNRYPLRDLHKQLLRPKRNNSCLQGLRRSDIITPGTSTVALFKTMILWLARLQEVSNTASSKRLHYVWTILHKVGGTSAKRSSQLGDFAFGSHYFSHPMPALYCFVLRWLRHTRHGVGCLARCRERTRLTVTISFSRLIVRLQRYEVFSNYRPIIERKIWINLKINTI